jgi:hypothetical protein
MFCDRCGAGLPDGVRFCSSCGRDFAAPSAPLPVDRLRVARHVRTLGILWLIRAGLRLLSAAFFTTMFSHYWWWDGMPSFMPGIARGIGGFILLGAIAGGICGWGLLERRPWARTLSLVLGVLALFDFPVGTALGIYTLWVMAPSTSDAEYRALSAGSAQGWR